MRFDRQDTVSLFENGVALQNAWAGGLNFPLFNSVDLNGDGVKDMVAYDRVNSRLTCYVNDGSNSLSAWKYDPSYASKFPYINRWALMYDYNCDGNEDLFTLSPIYPSCIACYRNDYSPATGLRFTLVDPILEESFSTTVFPVFASGVLLPAFDDVDGDGDMDILGYNSIPDGRVILHKNESMETYGICDSLIFNYANACWGNFAFRVGGANEVGCFGCPCRGSSNPYLNDPLSYSYEEAKRDDTVTSIFSIDIDGDADKDLLVGDISALTSLLVYNGGTSQVAAMDSQDVNYPSMDIPAIFNGFHSHAYLDVDNDGLKDLIVSPNEYENKAAQWIYKNQGSSSLPVFHRLATDFLQNTMLDVGENAAPVVIDLDSDGLNDLVVAGSVYDTASSYYSTRLYYLHNIGTSSVPIFDLMDDDLAGISTLAYNSTIYPAFGDLDNDGDKDLLLGTEDGKLQYFINNSGAFQLAVANFMAIDVGNNATPQLVDLDRDGKLDIVSGEKNGFINLYKNIGTTNSAAFSSIPSEDTLGRIILQSPGYTDGYSVPFVYDSAGTYRLAASNMAGNVYFYGNIDGNILGAYTLIDSLYDVTESSRIRFNVSVGGGDLNNDGFCDLVIGQSSGGAQLWYQHNGTSDISSPESQLQFSVYPNPAHDNLLIVFDDNDARSLSRLVLMDQLGRSVTQMDSWHNRVNLSLRGLSSGIYFLKMERNNAVAVTRIIIQD